MNVAVKGVHKGGAVLDTTAPFNIRKPVRILRRGRVLFYGHFDKLDRDVSTMWVEGYEPQVGDEVTT